MAKSRKDPTPAAADHASLIGQHAIVTGAARGIGAAIAERLSRMGAELTLMGRDAAALEIRREEIASNQPGAHGIVAVDVTDEASVRQAFDTAINKRGTPSILVNNAGVAGSAPFARATLDQWRRMIDVNLMGAVSCTQQVYPAMAERGYGRIVNVASTSGLKGYAYVTAYSASKHAVVGFTRSLALEAAKTGVTVNAVCPGFTDTDIVRETIANIVAKTGRTEEQARQELAATNPQGRLVLPQEVADAVAWLCLRSSGAITGQSIVVAGGEVM
jgi:NAD(P)-dependent dehydrogenase (short-subunit alcohol dehydrogenase family)